MIGRAAIRNPWIFQQIRQALSGQPVVPVTLEAVRDYIEYLRQTPTASMVREQARVNYMKMYLNFIGPGVDAAGGFLREMRQARTEAELWGVCDRYLLGDSEAKFALEPYPGLVARPSCETSCESTPDRSTLKRRAS
jgi:tRNA-dihydrouridine synthase